MTSSHTNRGFTLIELLVVVAIISLLSSIMLASLQSARIRATQAKTLTEMRQIGHALNLYYTDHGRYPTGASTFTGTWPQLQSDLRPYMKVPYPDFSSTMDSNGFVTAGYSYYQGGPHVGLKRKIFNVKSGEYKACVTIYDGFYLIASIPGGQTSVTENDGGPALGSIDPLMSAFGRVDIGPPNDCPSDASSFTY